MPALVQCLKCSRRAWATVTEDDPTTNAFECEPDWDDWQSVMVDGIVYFYENEDPECWLWREPCQHEDYEVIDYDYGQEPD